MECFKVRIREFKVSTKWEPERLNDTIGIYSRYFEEGWKSRIAKGI
jgi:hypothetical protein